MPTVWRRWRGRCWSWAGRRRRWTSVPARWKPRRPISLRSLAAALLDLRQEQAVLVAAQLYQLDGADRPRPRARGAALAADRRSGDALPELRQGAALLQAQKGWARSKGGCGISCLSDTVQQGMRRRRTGRFSGPRAMPRLGIARPEGQAAGAKRRRAAGGWVGERERHLGRRRPTVGRWRAWAVRAAEAGRCPVAAAPPAHAMAPTPTRRDAGRAEG